jgi:phosphoglycolate phosphatase-like HAD superfamily hydrolase
MVKPQFAIFGWSGVISDDFETTLNSINSVLNINNKPTLTEKEFKETFNLDFPEFWGKNGLNYTKDNIQNEFNRIYKSEINKTKIFHYVPKAIKQITSNIQDSFIISAHPAEFLNTKIREYNLQNYFRSKYGDVQNKRVLLTELSKISDPNKICVITDVDQDIKIGNDLGLQTYAVLSGYNLLDRIEKAKPTEIFENVSKIAKYIKTT